MQFAAVQGGSIFVTANSGGNVVAAGELGRRQWTSLACSTTGVVLRSAFSVDGCRALACRG